MNNLLLLSPLVLYELLDIVPCALLAAAPFHEEPHSRRKVAAAIAVLYVLGIFRRLLAGAHPAGAALLSVLWILLYLLAFRIVYRTMPAKILFILITVLNFASLIAILYSYLGGRLFGTRLQDEPYGPAACFTLFFIWLVFFPPLFYFMRRRAAPLISSRSNEGCWHFLWLVPATFCVFFYYNLYSGGGVLAFASNTHNFIFAMVITAGFFFVLSLVMRLVLENELVLRLRSENYQLSLQSLQYQSLLERIEETRRARHDLRQCMAVIQSYLQNGDREALQRFAAAYCQTLPGETPLEYCRHPALNAVVSYYGQRAAEAQVRFEAHIQYPSASVIPDTDIVVLLGNLLENAVEACRRQPASGRFIRLSLQTEPSSVVIALDNSYQGAPLPASGAFASAKHAEPGVGLASVRRIAEKHNGLAHFEGDGAVFHASVVLFL